MPELPFISEGHLPFLMASLTEIPLFCGSMRIHVEHTWTGPVTGHSYRCSGVANRSNPGRKLLPS